jgi:hypothetical protein
MTGRKGAHRGSRNPFLLAYAAVTLVAAGMVAAGFQWLHSQAQQPIGASASASQPHRSPAARPKQVHVQGQSHTDIPAAAWGHVAHHRTAMLVTLGPAADRRRRYEESSGRVAFRPAGLLVSNDAGRTFFVLQGQPMGRCGYHWQGYGVNAILANRKCVPGWATSKAGRHAQQWMRIENLVPFARLVLVKFA